MTQSLQSRLSITLLSATGALLIVTAVVLIVLIRSTLIAQFDDSIRAEAVALAELVEWESGQVQSEVLEEKDNHSEHDFTSSHFYALYTLDGRAIERSELHRVVGSNADSFDTPIADAGHSDIRQIADLRVVRLTTSPRVESDEHSDDDGQVGGVGVTGERERQVDAAPAPPLVLLYYGRSSREVARSIATLQWIIVLTFLGTIGLSFLLTYRLVGHGLQPLAKTAAQFEGIDADDLSQRIRVKPAPAEIATVAKTANELLARLQRSFQREQEFSANAAHDLRTPLAGLRSSVDVALARERTAHEYRRVLDEVRGIGAEMERTVEDLLTLAKLDAGSATFECEEFDLNACVLECWRPFQSTADSRKLRVSWKMDDVVRIRSSRPHVRQMLKNLFDNAVSYCETGGSIDVDTQLRNGQVSIRIANSGNRLTHTELDKVCDRFWRGDQARSQIGHHAGLGLSVCRQLAEELMLTMDLTVEGPTFIATISESNGTQKRDGQRHARAGAV